MRIVALADTHNLHRGLSIPDGDILIHAGDITAGGTLRELADFAAYFDSLPHRHKIIVAGNHDFCFEQNREKSVLKFKNCIYLQDQSITIEGVKFYGSPWQPWFLDWAFNLDRGPEMREKWDLIPPDTDVLITHGPPFGVRDKAYGEHLGCQDLLEALERVRPSVHIFGHIHEGAGITSNKNIIFINASSCNGNYELVNAPIVYDYDC